MEEIADKYWAEYEKHTGYHPPPMIVGHRYLVRHEENRWKHTLVADPGHVIEEYQYDGVYANFGGQPKPVFVVTELSRQHPGPCDDAVPFMDLDDEPET
jgi:hypothetical protein